jgi:type VI protein secretion system component Hcp
MIGDNYMWFVDTAHANDLPIGETTDQWFAQKKAFELSHFTIGMSGADEKTVQDSPQSSPPSRSIAGLDLAAPRAGSQRSQASAIDNDAGKTKFNQLKIAKLVDLASVKFYQACSQGVSFDTAYLVVRKAGGAHLLFMQYIFRLIRVVGVDWEGGSGSEAPTENVDLIFKAMGFRYIQQDASGYVATKIDWLWSTVQGTPTLSVKPGEQPPTFLPDTVHDVPTRSLR